MMTSKRGLRYVLVGVGVAVFGYGMIQFASAIRLSHRYDSVHHEAVGQVSASKTVEPARMAFLLRVLAAMRHETHEHLAYGLFGAASGMTALALGVRGLQRERRQAMLSLLDERRALVDERRRGERVAASDERWAQGSDRCALSAAPPRVRMSDVENDELALLERFEALERLERAHLRG